MSISLFIQEYAVNTTDNTLDLWASDSFDAFATELDILEARYTPRDGDDITGADADSPEALAVFEAEEDALDAAIAAYAATTGVAA